VDLNQLLVLDPLGLHTVTLTLDLEKACSFLLRFNSRLIDILVHFFNLFVDDFDLDIGCTFLFDDQAELGAFIEQGPV
jgi:hypothetical protein